MLKRFGRLWPLHVSVLAVFVGINIIRLSLYGWYGLSQRVNASWSALGLSAFEHVTFLQAATFLPQPAGVLTNVPSWSISTEFWTYLLFALITAGFGKNVTIIKCLVALFSAFMVVHFSANGLDVDNWLGFFRCFFGFFLGQLVYLAYTSRPHDLGFLKASVAEWMLLLATITFVGVARRGELSFAAPLVFACVVYGFAAETGVISRWLKTRVMQALGNYSYSIYMIHILIIAATCGALHIIGKLTHRELIKHIGINYRIAFGPAWMMVGFALLMLVLIVAISSVTYKQIEKPGQRFFSKLAHRVQQDRILLREASEQSIPVEAE